MKPLNTRFQLAARGMIINDDKILLTYDHHLKFHFLPGGKIEYFEKARQALQREILEETGRKCKVNQLLFVVENFFQFNNENLHEISLVFSVDLFGDSLQVSSRESHISFEYIPIKYLSDIDFKPNNLITAIQSYLTHHLIDEQYLDAR